MKKYRRKHRRKVIHYHSNYDPHYYPPGPNDWIWNVLELAIKWILIIGFIWIILILIGIFI
jgi:hypothetical protein